MNLHNSSHCLVFTKKFNIFNSTVQLLKTVAHRTFSQKIVNKHFSKFQSGFLIGFLFVLFSVFCF